MSEEIIPADFKEIFSKENIVPIENSAAYLKVQVISLLEEINKLEFAYKNNLKIIHSLETDQENAAYESTRIEGKLRAKIAGLQARCNREFK